MRVPTAVSGSNSVAVSNVTCLHSTNSRLESTDVTVGVSPTAKSSLGLPVNLMTTTKRFPCYKCGKNYSIKSTSDRRLRFKCGSSQRMWTCQKCSKIYKSKSSLARHIRYECGKDPQFSCEFCPKAFKQADNFKRHYILRHLKPNKFK
ncbi:zinc finger protein 85-like [Phymastichus coffea]|uniref:zinc finger protein 85-like n=1 Tax=Phymastichus coffea TaxID=108790 RepID=UPI00273BD166|nr:zinc finger protein 85-like [Phymastichus coffea]